MRREKIKELTKVSLLVAVMAVTSQISIPTAAVPITLQAFVIAMTGFIMGAKKGTVTVGVYILLGMVGVPVFSGLQGGVSAIVGYTGGFILGFLPFAFCCGFGGRASLKIAFAICGILICHAMGVFHYSLMSGVSLPLSFVAVSLPYLLKDIFLTLCAYFFASTLKKRLKI